jgi:hypothetical protein
MKINGERDFIFAGAGILWGAVQVYRGCQLWRQEQQRLRASRDCAVDTLPMSRVEFPSMIVMGALFMVGCTGYVLLSVFSD